MKRIGGKAKFNPITKEWESQPVKYVEFHCTPEEWNKLGNSKFLLIRDWVLSKMDWYNPEVRCFFENFNDFRDLVNDMVHEIICDRYDLDITCSKDGGYKVFISGAPFPFYLSSHEMDLWEYDYLEGCLVEILTGICKGVFGVINTVRKYGKYIQKFQSGEYAVREVVYKSKLIKWECYD
jgi:hypothetical protein